MSSSHRTKLSSPTSSSTASLHQHHSSSSSSSNMNYSLNMLNEIKKFNQNAQQLNILLDETNNACKELKVLSLSADSVDNFQLHAEDEQFVQSLQSKKICFVIFGQNVLAKSILVNEILSRYLLPFQLSERVDEESWRMIRIKHGKLPGYTFQLVDTEFELMSSEYLNKKFIFTGTTPPVQFTAGSSSPPESFMDREQTGANNKNGPINIKATSPPTKATALSSPNKSFSLPQTGAINPFLSASSSTFTVPLEDLRLDKELVEARAKFENLISRTTLDQATGGIRIDSVCEELDDAKFNLEKAEAIAENQAVLEINLDNRLLEQNVEILVHSKSMPKYVYEKLAQDIIPIYLYGIIGNKLSEQDIRELKDIQGLVNSSPILFVKIPEIDNFLEHYSSPPTPASAETSPSQSHLTSEWTRQQLEQHQSLKRANQFLKYLITSSQMLAAATTTTTTSSSSPPSNTAAFTSRHALTTFSQLCDLGFLNVLPTTNYATLDDMASTIASLPHDYSYYSGGSTCLSPHHLSKATTNSHEHNSQLISSLVLVESELCEKWHSFMHFLFNYVNRNIKSFLIKGAAILSKFHEYCLSKFINFAYEMARDMLVTPRKIEYAREKEQILFDSLNSLASMKQEELKNLINSTIEVHRHQILDMARNYEFVNVELIRSPILAGQPASVGLGSVGSANSTSQDPYTSRSIPQVQGAHANSDSGGTDVHESVSSNSSATSSSTGVVFEEYVTVKYAKDYKKCTNQIQELVVNRLNNAIGQKLTESVEILKENYIGTLKRCLQTLEELNSSSSSPSVNGSSMSFSGQYPPPATMISTHPYDGSSYSISSSSVSEALQQILNAAYQVEVNFSGSSSFLKLFIQRMKELIKNMPWTTSPNLNEEWKVTIASNMLDSLSESKLAKILCSQMRERLTSSHYLFTQSLKLLESKHSGRLEKTEESQNVIRKVLAPKFAKLNLETTSLKDYVLYGMPVLSKEIGRGQYGVVYNCARWAKYENLAIKSVVPPDEKHWNDLALEYHYTKQIIDHDRIVKLLGSVIDYSYGNGQSPAVLLIMELMKRDLYTALKVGLDWRTRMQLSMDVVEGIRYLHGRGLVHRDIKLKNVLLDSHNRAKITDLGFCKPEAMMSGSIVGTPIHMSPEVFNSKYDSSVDIYAFGILFWYICSGSVRLPHNFEMCSTKDDLWSAVKRGIRPERLSLFDDDCWTLMESCWRHDPKQRPHIGVVASSLDKILAKCPLQPAQQPSSTIRLRKT